MRNLDICFASDEGYAPFMGVAISSVLENAAPDEFIRFHILDNGISKLNKQRIDSLKEKYSSYSVSYYPINPSLFRDLPIINSHLSHTAYARLFIGSFLPEDLERLIYLDCDIFVKSSLSDLFETQLEGCILGGVPDMGIMEKARKEEHPWPYQEGMYVNSGVLLIDLVRWRKEEVEKRLWQYTEAPRYPLQFEDQDIINFALCGRIKELPFTWNGLMSMGNAIFDKTTGIRSLRRSLLDCKIVHFASPAKPWMKDSGWHPNIKQYQQFMKKTPWADQMRCIPAKQLWRNIFRYWKVHPVFFLKPKSYRKLYWEGVSIFR